MLNWKVTIIYMFVNAALLMFSLQHSDVCCRLSDIYNILKWVFATECNDRGKVEEKSI